MVDDVVRALIYAAPLHPRRCRPDCGEHSKLPGVYSTCLILLVGLGVYFTKFLLPSSIDFDPDRCYTIAKTEADTRADHFELEALSYKSKRSELLRCSPSLFHTPILAGRVPPFAFIVALVIAVVDDSTAMLSLILFAAYAGTTLADITPTAPGPGDTFAAGSDCTIKWTADTSGQWTNVTICEFVMGNFSRNIVHIMYRSHVRL